MADQQVTPYDLLGGEIVLRKLVKRFYDYMDILPESREIRRMHAESLKQAEEKLFMFLSGWLGGPNLYWETYGHPMLRMRHLPFAIGVRQRDQWMLCMRRALEDCVEDGQFRERLLDAFGKTADHMINQPPQA
jgi:hemoglobin